MPKGEPLTRHQERIVKNYYEHLDTATLQKLAELVSDLYVSPDAAKENRRWESARLALAKVPVDAGRVAGVLDRKDVAGLAALVNELSKRPAAAAAASPAASPAPPGPAPAHPPAPAPTGAAADAIPPEVLKSALKAFRKRLKLSRLDEESQLGRSPLTGGGKSGIIAIVPPNQFPHAVWEELVRQGHLRHNGREFYELVNP